MLLIDFLSHFERNTDPEKGDFVIGWNQKGLTVSKKDKFRRIGLEMKWDKLGLKMDKLGLKMCKLGLKIGKIALKMDKLGLKWAE